MVRGQDRLDRLDSVAERIEEKIDLLIKVMQNVQHENNQAIPALGKDIERLLKEIRVYRRQLGLREV